MQWLLYVLGVFARYFYCCVVSLITTLGGIHIYRSYLQGLQISWWPKYLIKSDLYAKAKNLLCIRQDFCFYRWQHIVKSFQLIPCWESKTLLYTNASSVDNAVKNTRKPSFGFRIQFFLQKSCTYRNATKFYFWLTLSTINYLVVFFWIYSTKKIKAI